MKTFYKRTFMSWYEEGSVFDPVSKQMVHERVRSIALCNGTWFHAAINTQRDGSMGAKDENGVYERIWWEDDVMSSDAVTDFRPATLAEVELYLKYCPIEEEAEKDGLVIEAIVYGGDRTDVYFSEKR